MKRINSYIRQNVLGGIAIVFLVFAGLDVVMSLIDQQSDLIGNYKFGNSVLQTFMTMPGRMDIYLPFVVLIGCLVGLGQLAASSELIILRASGVSTYRIVWMAMKPCLAVALVAIALGEFVAPDLDRQAQNYKAQLQWGGAGLLSEYGLWLRDGHHFANAAAVEPDGALYGLSIYRVTDDWRIDQAMQARRAVWKGDYWLLEHVVETRLPGETTERHFYPLMRWYATVTPDMLRILMLKPRDLSARDLWYFSRYLQAQGLDSGEYRLNFWNETLKIFAIASLVLVAASFIFGTLRSATLGSRVFAGIVIGLVFNTLHNILGPASMVFGFSPFIAVMLPIIGTGVLGMALLARAR